VIVLNERHLKRLMSEYVRYYHEDQLTWVWRKTRQRVDPSRSVRQETGFNP
jgi:hypothetical protein